MVQLEVIWMLEHCKIGSQVDLTLRSWRCESDLLKQFIVHSIDLFHFKSSHHQPQVPAEITEHRYRLEAVTVAI